MSTGLDTVGSLLAGIATSLNDGLRILMFADKRQWGPDEFEQVRALEEALDEAKRDFQSLSPLVNGQFYYENDRRAESLEELRALHKKFDFHAQNFKDWLRQGGPINPTWALETVQLRRELHRAQCRAACRIFATGPGPDRCLGAFQVRRRQRESEAAAAAAAYATTPASDGAGGGSDLELGGGPPAAAWAGYYNFAPSGGRGSTAPSVTGAEGGVEGEDRDGRTVPQQQPQMPHQQRTEAPRRPPPLSLEALVPDCNAVGKFERFGDRDIAFCCDFCDGFLVWEDLKSMPSRRTAAAVAAATASEALVGMSASLVGHATLISPISPTMAGRSPWAPAAVGEAPSPTRGSHHHDHPNHLDWQATGRAVSDGEEKEVVFAPLAIANHLLPANGDWRARILCPFCDEYTYYAEGDGGDELRYAQDERGFADVKAFQEHLEWYHSGGLVPMPSAPTKKNNCCVM